MKVKLILALVVCVTGCAPSTVHAPLINKILLEPLNIAVHGHTDTVYIVNKGLIKQNVVDLLVNRYKGACIISETLQCKILKEYGDNKKYEDSEFLRIQPADTNAVKGAYLFFHLSYSSYDRKWHLRQVVNGYYFFGAPDQAKDALYYTR